MKNALVKISVQMVTLLKLISTFLVPSISRMPNI
jgi:hypothetical protein